MMKILLMIRCLFVNLGITKNELKIKMYNLHQIYFNIINDKKTTLASIMISLHFNININCYL